MSASCGLYPVRAGLVAVVVARDGRASPPLRAGSTAMDHRNLLHRIDATGDIELVLPDWLARTSPLGEVVAQSRMPVWIAPAGLVEATLIIARAHGGVRSAAAIARLLLPHGLRASLRPIPQVDPRQLNLV